MRLRTALTLFKTAYGFYSPPRFAGGKLVEEVLYRTLLILQNQLLPQVCLCKLARAEYPLYPVEYRSPPPAIYRQKYALAKAARYHIAHRFHAQFFHTVSSDSCKTPSTASPALIP